MLPSRRRIIVSDDILKLRIADLCKAFISCGYPTSMVQRISGKVVNIKRDLNVLIKKVSSNAPRHHRTDNVRIVSTFGTDELLVQCVKEAIPHLQNTNTFKSKDVSFKFVKKTALVLNFAVLRKMS